MELATPNVAPNFTISMNSEPGEAVQESTTPSAESTPNDDQVAVSDDSQQPASPTADNENALQYPAVDLTFDDPSEGAGNARDLSPANWRIVLETNSLLYGFHIRESNQDVVRARQNAFVLKQPNKGSNVRPHFQVEDGSSIQIQETKNAFQRSLAQNAFSKRCIESNLSVGDFGIMAGLSGKREHEKARSDSSQKAVRDQEYYAVFNFPRTRLLLDEEELQLSEKCQAALIEIQTEPSYERLQRFYKLFGHVFVTSVLLGGQQKTAKFAAALSIKDEELQQDALRSAVGAKINAQYISTSAQLSRERGSNETRGDQKYTNLSYLGMSASGGNTLIGSDIPKWAQTVAPFKNWRVIENEIAEPIHDLIGRLPNWGHIPRLFRVIGHSRTAAYRPWRLRFSLLTDGKPLCWITKNGLPQLYASNDEHSKRAIFNVLPADGEVYSRSVGHDGRLFELRPDWPLWLSTDLDPNPKGLGSAYLGIEPTNGGWGRVTPQFDKPQQKCFRFSLRQSGRSGPWSPNPYISQVIKSGDQVNLYCHSLGLGPFGNINRAPCYASPAISVLGSPDLVFVLYEESYTLETRKLITAYDTNVLGPAEKEAFEKMGIISIRDYAPGPNVGTTSKTSELSFGPLKLIQTENLIECAVIEGKKIRVDYKMLQREPYKSASLNWDRCQRDIAMSPSRRGYKTVSSRQEAAVIADAPIPSIPWNIGINAGVSQDLVHSTDTQRTYKQGDFPRPVVFTLLYE